jgi:hypothetical protein
MNLPFDVYLLHPAGVPGYSDRREWLDFEQSEFTRPSWTQLLDAWTNQVDATFGPQNYELVYPEHRDVVRNQKAFDRIMSELPLNATEVVFKLEPKMGCPGESAFMHMISTRRN